jgi:membrane-associated phospholipid phosphatase
VSSGRRAGGLLTPTVYAGIVVLAVMWVVVAVDPHLKLNREVLNLIGTSHHTALGRHAKLIADIGTILGLVVTAGTLLAAARRRWWRTCGVILVGFVLSYALSDAIKAIEDRPRPARPVIPAGGSSFPSSDSAVSIGFVLVAIVLCRLADGRVPPRVALSLGVAASVATGVLTIVFRDHKPTDVLAGWGLGAAVFAAASLWARIDRELAR